MRCVVNWRGGWAGSSAAAPPSRRSTQSGRRWAPVVGNRHRPHRLLAGDRRRVWPGCLVPALAVLVRPVRHGTAAAPSDQASRAAFVAFSHDACGLVSTDRSSDTANRRTPTHSTDCGGTGTATSSRPWPWWLARPSLTWRPRLIVSALPWTRGRCVWCRTIDGRVASWCGRTPTRWPA